MHPLTLWAISMNELAARESEQARLRAQRDSGTVQPAPLTRDQRWVAAIHRWAVAEPAQAAIPAIPAQTAPGARQQPRLGCA